MGTAFGMEHLGSLPGYGNLYGTDPSQRMVIRFHFHILIMYFSFEFHRTNWSIFRFRATTIMIPTNTAA